MPDHLTPTGGGDRGFTYLPPIDGAYGGTVRAYESSAARGPHVWLSARSPETDDGPAQEVILHLTAEAAWQFAEQLQALVRDHYQGDARPMWAKEVRDA